MKKILLLTSAIALSMFTHVQAQSNIRKQNTFIKSTSEIDNAVPSFFASANKRGVHINPMTVTSTRYISSSYNAFGVIVTQANCLTANQATNTVLFTHRINPDVYGAGAAATRSGNIVAHFSSNYGTTWDSVYLNQDAVTTSLSRYPSGGLYNPAGNTSPSGMTAVVAGPVTNSTNWTGNYFASTKLNNTNNHVDTRLNATAGVAHQDFVRIGMQPIANDKVIVTGGLYKNANGTTALAQLYRGASINRGSYAGTFFTWAVDSIKPTFKNRSNGTPYTYTEAIPAFSPDGMTGYIVFSGIDNAATGAAISFQPMVWKTTDGGTTWTHMPLFNFSSIPSINAKLKPAHASVKKAWYSMDEGFDATVDVNGNLHIVCTIASAATGFADSLDYAYDNAAHKSYIYDTYTTTAGSWGAFLVDSILTQPDTTTFINSQTNTGMYLDSRLQVSRSADGTHIFYVWIDSDPTATSDAFNAIPDIKARGYRVTSNTYTPTVQFTFDGVYYYMFASDITLVSGTTYNIPCSYSTPRSGSDAIMPFNHYFVSGIQFTESQFPAGTVGIGEVSENGNLSVSQNFPNPFSKATSIDVTLKEAGDVTVEVYNLLGSKMLSNNYEKMNSGTHTLTIDGSKLSSGVYFYTVKSGSYTISKKMIVE
jgi:hypothetical protein